jgi:hypothetical protein
MFVARLCPCARGLILSRMLAGPCMFIARHVCCRHPARPFAHFSTRLGHVRKAWHVHELQFAHRLGRTVQAWQCNLSAAALLVPFCMRVPAKPLQGTIAGDQPGQVHVLPPKLGYFFQAWQALSLYYLHRLGRTVEAWQRLLLAVQHAASARSVTLACASFHCTFET